MGGWEDKTWLFGTDIRDVLHWTTRDCKVPSCAGGVKTGEEMSTTVPQHVDGGGWAGKAVER